MKCKIKYKRAVLTFLAIMLIGANSFVYANETNEESTRSQSTQEEGAEDDLAEIYHRAGLDSPQVIINTLESLGVSNEELQEYVGKGKKIRHILEERDITALSFKTALENEYRCKIKEARKSKVITKKEAKILTSLLKEKMNHWDI